MTTTINGRTPEEIKRVLECCYGNKERRLCEKCPSACKVEGYSELICTDFDSSGENALAYIQQLERERDEARNDLDTLNYANTELHSAYEAMKRERDSAVSDLENNILPVKPLTLKEAIAFDDHPIWCEYRKIGLGFWTDVVLNHRDGRIVLRRYPPVPFYYEDADKYNVEYRCWARRPTDEERAAAVWEVE